MYFLDLRENPKDIPKSKIKELELLHFVWLEQKSGVSLIIVIMIELKVAWKWNLLRILKYNNDNAFYRLDFEDVVLHQPDAVGTCGGNGDALTIENPTSTFAGFNNLCGILSGQHSKILKWLLL